MLTTKRLILKGLVTEEHFASMEEGAKNMLESGFTLREIWDYFYQIHLDYEMLAKLSQEEEEKEDPINDLIIKHKRPDWTRLNKKC